MGRFNKKIELIVSKDFMRPNLCRIYFYNGYLYATDSHLAIRQSLVLYGFTKEEIEILNGNSLRAEEFIHLRSFENIEVTIEGLICQKKGVFSTFKFSEFESNFYNKIEKVIETTLNSEGDVNEIALNHVLLNKICQCLHFNSITKKLIFKFSQKNRAVIIYSDNHSIKEQVGLIMPIDI